MWKTIEFAFFGELFFFFFSFSRNCLQAKVKANRAMISYVPKNSLYVEYCKKIFHRMHFALVYSYMKQQSTDSRLIFFFKRNKNLLISIWCWMRFCVFYSICYCDLSFDWQFSILRPQIFRFF